MKENTYAVSLDVKASRSFTDSELCEYLGIKTIIEPELCEYLGNKNDKHEYWKFESTLDETDSLEDHIAELASLVHFDKPFEPDRYIKRFTLLIGVFFYTPICAIRISPKCLRIIEKVWPGIGIKFACYYCDEEEDEEE